MGLWEHILEALRQPHNWLLAGVAILAGHGGGKLAQRFRLPSVVGYLLVGVVLGRSVLDAIDAETAEVLGLVTDLGLGIVAFIIGSELSRSLLRRMGRSLTAILFCQFFGAVLLVLLLVWIFVPAPLKAWALPVALLFGAVAAATAPAGTVAVIQECKAKGPMTSMLLAVVGLDDGLAIVVYAFAAAAAKALLGGEHLSLGTAVGGPFLEIAGSLAVGGVVGALLTAALSRTRSRAEVLTLSLGAVLLVVGLANVLHLSLILANLAVGMAVANISRRETERASSAVEGISHPVYVFFFVVAGAHLDVRVLAATGLLLPVYILGRSAGKMAGAYAGTVIGKAEPVMRRWLGPGLLPQAGVAVGLALMTARELAPYGEVGGRISALVINTIAATTVFFEVVGPIVTKIALTRAGEVNAKKETGGDA